MKEQKEEMKEFAAIAKQPKKVVALKDYSCIYNAKEYHFKKDEPVEAPKQLMVSLKTEKVI